MTNSNLDFVLGVHDRNGYHIHSLATMHSVLYRTSTPVIPHIFHDDSLTDAVKDKFQKVAEHFGANALFHDVSERIKAIPEPQAWKNFSPGCMFRLFIPAELRGGTVLYLDSDIIATTDVASLLRPWLTSRDRPLWAVNDSFAREELFQPHLREIGILPENYFNSGVLLFHNDLLDNAFPGFTTSVMQLAKTNASLPFIDQDIINILSLRHNLAGFMPLKANFQTGLGRRANMEPAKLAGRIVHYTWHKPWEKIFPAGLLYWREREKLAEILKTC